MSEEVKPNSTPIHALPSSVQSDYFEESADELMNEIFSDIDSMLDGRRLPTKTVKLDYVALESVVVPPINVAVPENATASAANPQTTASTEDLKENLTQQPPTNPSASPSPRKSRRRQSQTEESNSTTGTRDWRQHTDKILFGSTCLLLVGVVSWLVWQDKLNLRPSSNATPSSALSNSNPSPDPDPNPFNQYMLRALQAIETQGQNIADGTATGNNMAANSTQNDPNNAQVVERVYIPVYPSNSNAPSPTLLPPPPQPTEETPSNNNSPAPAPQSNNNAENPEQQVQPQASNNQQPQANSTPTQVQASQPKPSPSPTKKTVTPSPSPKPQATTTTPPSVAASTRSIPIPSPSAASTVSPPPKPNGSNPSPSPSPTLNRPPYKLVGIVEAGSDSMALFKIGNTTRRITVGETIGTSGWALVAAENQSAVVRRNGEVRSVFVGQDF